MTLWVFTRPSSPNRDLRMTMTNLMHQGSKEAAVDPIVLVGEDEAAAEAIAKAEAAEEVEAEAVEEGTIASASTVKMEMMSKTDTALQRDVQS